MEAYALKYQIIKSLHLFSSEETAKWGPNQALPYNIKVYITNLKSFITQIELMETFFTLATSLSSNTIKNK